jgi:predicted enzyme related to lactoylglutathione lyase
MIDVRGRILWYELLTKDVQAAEDFYTKVVGWKIQPFEGAPERYDMWTRDGGQPIGGVMAIPPGAEWPPNWMMYVGVPQLEEAVAHIERLGGKALSPVIEVPNVGRMRAVQDPQGAVFSVYQPASDWREPEAEAEIGGVSWHELMTTDAPAALRFYSELFGWRETQTMDMGPMGKYHIFGRTIDLGGMMNKPSELAQVPPNWGVYFRVPDVAAAAERVKANGGQVLNGPMEVPGGGSIVNCMDPQGAAFSMHHAKP